MSTNGSSNGSVISNGQALILKALAKAGESGLTLEALKEKVGEGVALNCGTLGPVAEGVVANYPESLRGRSLVKCDKIDGEGGGTFFRITVKGTKLAGMISSRKVIKAEDKVPMGVLAKAVLKVKDTKPYGLELWTDKDVNEARELCGKEFGHVKPDDLRQQITNLRKRGAFSKDTSVLPTWYIEYRSGDHFADLETAALKAAGHVCTINPSHDEELVVRHRTLETLGKEKGKDLIVLCPACLKRLRLSLPQVPEDAPGDDLEVEAEDVSPKTKSGKTSKVKEEVIAAE